MGGVRTRPTEGVLRELTTLSTERVTVCFRDRPLEMGARLKIDSQRPQARFYVDDHAVTKFAPEDVTVVSWLPSA